MIHDDEERERRVEAERLSIYNHLAIDDRMTAWHPNGLNLTNHVYPPHQFAEICFSFHLSDQVPAEVRAMYERGKATMSYGIYHYPLITVACDYLHRMMEAALFHYLKIQDPASLKKRNTFGQMLSICRRHGYIDEDMFPRWEATRWLRNTTSHKVKENMNLPNDGLSSLGVTKELMEALFVFGPPNLGNFYRFREKESKYWEVKSSIRKIVSDIE